MKEQPRRSKVSEHLISALNELERENHRLNCDLGDLRDLVAELVVDLENNRTPHFLPELVRKYRELYPLGG